MTTEERLELLEKEMVEVRWRLNLGPPPEGGLGGIPIGTAGEILQPDQLPGKAMAQQMELVNRIAKAQQTPPLTLAEACEKYRDEEMVTAYFKNSASLTDHADFVRVQIPKGWQKVPKRYAPQLQGLAEVVPEAMDQP